MRASPKEASASPRVSSQAAVELGRRLRTTRMPLPPPPAAALSMSGKPMVFAAARASASESTVPAVPGTIGTPAARAAARAASLSPSAAMVAGRGPMKAMPASSQACANAAFSAKKP